MGMNDRMNMNQVRERFIVGIHDNYTLNLAISLTEEFDKVGIINNNLMIEKMKLEQQLQEHKDKEYKLREILKHEYSDAILGKFGTDLKYGLLQILNEEVK